MTLLYVDWGYIHDKEIIAEFENKGITVKQRKFSEENKGLFLDNFNHDQNKEIEGLLEENMDEEIELVFSINFISVISNWCQQKKIPYASWVLDLPNYDLYTQAIYNSCNYIGIGDSYLVEKLLKIGVKKVFLLPDAVSNNIEEPKKYEEREFCYIAKSPIKTLSLREISLYTKGYLEAFLHVQRVLHGEVILEEGLLNRVYNELLNRNKIPSKIIPTMERLYFSDYYLNPECISLRENIFLQNHSNLITIYSNEEFPMCKGNKFPFIEEEEKRREIYRKKEFSLILTPYTNHHGIDRNVLEVIAAGGFPVCSYQKDYDVFFSKNKNLAYFTNRVEFMDIITRYGNHLDAREELQKEAYRHVMDNHTYKNRIDTMLYFWEKLS